MSNPYPQMPHTRSDEAQRVFLRSDREDLLAVLTLRFGSVPELVQTRIAACDEAATLERWILVAANVPDWASFLNDLDAGPNAFKLVGASYEPAPTESVSDVSSVGAHEPHVSITMRPKEE